MKTLSKHRIFLPVTVPNDTSSARRDLDDEDMINVLERCYQVLHGRRNSTAISATSTATSINSNPQPATAPNSTRSLLSKHMKRYVFDEIKLRLTKLDHNLYDIIWPSVKKLPTETSFRLALEQDFPLGLVAPDFHIYKVFHLLFDPVLKDLNSIDLHYEIPNHPESKFNKNDNEDGPVDIDLDLDPQLKYIISGLIRLVYAN